MLPHHILTAVTILRIDLGHQLGRPMPAIVGAGVFTGRVDRGEVEFTLDTIVLTPIDTSSNLFRWLDLALQSEQATITGYDLNEITVALGASPDADWSTAMRALSGCGPQPVIDTVLHGPDHTTICFANATLSAGIPCATPNSDATFNAWMTGRQAMLSDCLAIDAIASWRLAMTRIADRSALGHRVNAAIERHLADWLRQHRSAAAAPHLESLARNPG
jgi:hypothetical protein